MSKDNLKVITTGVSFGNLAAAALSYSINKSIGYAILHGLCSWFYIIYHYFINKS